MLLLVTSYLIPMIHTYPQLEVIYSQAVLAHSIIQIQEKAALQSYINFTQRTKDSGPSAHQTQKEAIPDNTLQAIKS